MNPNMLGLLIGPGFLNQVLPNITEKELSEEPLSKSFSLAAPIKSLALIV